MVQMFTPQVTPHVSWLFSGLDGGAVARRNHGHQDTWGKRYDPENVGFQKMLTFSRGLVAKVILLALRCPTIIANNDQLSCPSAQEGGENALPSADSEIRVILPNWPFSP